MQGRMVENARITPAFVPVNTTGAAQTGIWVSMKYFRRLLILLQQGAWAGGTPAVTLQQAQDASGTGAKALSMDYYFQSTSTNDVPTKTAISSGTFNLPNQANTLTQIEVQAYDLDINNGFSYVQVNVASPGSNADLVAGLYQLYDADWAGDPTTTPSVLA